MLITAHAQAISLKAKLFRGFADPSRLAILEALRTRPSTVSEIAEATGLSQSNASNHLSCLRDCGLVSCERQGRYIYYRLSGKRVISFKIRYKERTQTRYIYYRLSGKRVIRLLRLTDEILADVVRGVYECTRYNLDEYSKDK